MKANKAFVAPVSSQHPETGVGANNGFIDMPLYRKGINALPEAAKGT